MSALIRQSRFHLIVFDIAIVASFLPEWYGSLFQRVAKGTAIRDRGSHSWLVVALVLGALVAFRFVYGVPSTTITRHQHVWFWSGLALLFAGARIPLVRDPRPRQILYAHGRPLARVNAWWTRDPAGLSGILPVPGRW